MPVRGRRASRKLCQPLIEPSTKQQVASVLEQWLDVAFAAKSQGRLEFR